MPIPYATTFATVISVSPTIRLWSRRRVKSRARTLFISSLHTGYDMPLIRMFDGGQELSIGQWQKVFMHHSEVITLDEPTSALDFR